MSRIERLYSPPEIGAPGKRAARSRRKDLVLAAAFFLAMAALAATAVVLVVPGIFTHTYRLHAYFPDAGNLHPGVQVVQNGYTIGLLESLRPVFPGRDSAAGHCPDRRRGDSERASRQPCFHATLRILGDWPVMQGSLARFGSAGILQGDIIEILPGNGTERLPDDARITAVEPEPDLGSQLSALTDSLQSIIDESIAPALASLEHQIRTIEALLGTGEDNAANRDRLAGAFENLQQLTGGLAQAVQPDQIANILASVEQLSANLNQVSADLTERTGAIEQAVNQYASLAADIRTLLRRNGPSVERSLDDTQYLLQELSSALTPILTNVEDATRNLSALSRDLRNNPAVIIRGHEAKEDTPWFQ
jgi:phospholipid/cholesterol/gamma-HCH transport system substrate-binding protein